MKINLYLSKFSYFMDILLAILGFICCVVGVFGSFLPVLPGPIVSWIGLLLLYLTQKIENNYWVLGCSFCLMLFIIILDYTIPAKGTKRFGGTKYGIWGTNIGLIIGLFFPPIGFVAGPFIGALIGELIFDFNNPKGAILSATGSFVGFLASTFIKFIYCFSLLIMLLYLITKNFIFSNH